MEVFGTTGAPEIKKLTETRNKKRRGEIVMKLRWERNEITSFPIRTIFLEKIIKKRPMGLSEY